MGLNIVLNETSLINAANDIPTTKQLMSDLLDTIIAAASVAGRGNSSIEVCTPKSLTALPLAPQYPLGRWLGDRTVDELQRRLFVTIATKKPYIDDITESYEEEFLYQQKPVKSLGYAFQKGALAVSLLSDPCWDYSHLEIEYHQLDASGELTINQVDIIHASRKTHVQEHTYWIKASLQAEAQHSITDGSTLWKYREELFPHLQFCAIVETQLQAISLGDAMMHPTLSKLFLLEQFCKDWLEGPFVSNRIACKVTRESPSTLAQYSRERTFLCPDGEPRCFDWHVRLTPHAWRIYFFPLEEKRRLIIGYIGHHLTTVKYR